MKSMQAIYGIHPVLETLRSGGEGIETIILVRGKKGDAFREIVKLADQKKIRIKYEDRSTVDRLAMGKRHQGVVCVCEQFSYTPFHDIVLRTKGAESGGVILILDSVTDPQNLGSLIRSAHCFGVQGVVIPKDRAAPVSPAAMKASAGSAGYTAVAQVANIASTIDSLKEEGFWIYGADASKGRDARQFDFSGPVGLVLGSEGAGLPPLDKQKCDFLISIPMVGKIDSLNVSVAGGVLLYEIMRNRRSGPLPEIEQ